MWCLSCSELHKCPSATGDMIVQGLGCAKWTEVDGAVLEAREELVMTLGPHSILSKPNPRKNKDEEEYTMSTNDEKRSKLRLLAIKSGLLQKIELAKSLRWTTEQLVERLEESYEGCADWSDSDLDDAIANVGKKKRQPSKTATAGEVEKAEAEAEAESESESPVEKKRQPAKKRKRTKKAAETAPVAESEEESSDSTEKASKKRKPATRKKRQPSKSEAGEAQPAVFQVDGKSLIEEFGLADVKDQVVSNQTLLAGLTVETEDIKSAVIDLAKLTAELAKTVDQIEKFCVWFYNSETDEEISELKEVF